MHSYMPEISANDLPARLLPRDRIGAEALKNQARTRVHRKFFF